MINLVTDVTFEMTLICNCLYLTEQQVTTLISCNSCTITRWHWLTLHYITMKSS